MVSRQWLEQRRALTGRSFVFPSPQVPLSPALQQACRRVLDLIGSPHAANQNIDAQVEQLLLAAVDSSSEQSGLEFFRLTMQGMGARSEEHTSELQSLMRISYAVFCLKKKTKNI